MIARLRTVLVRLSAPRALLVLAVAFVATALCAVLLAVQDDPAEAPTDIAFLDAAATTDLVSSATALVNQVFSVDPRHPKATTRLIEEHLTAQAQAEFRELYAPYLSRKAAGITLQTSATSVAVVALRGDSADVLVIADQRASAPDGRTNAGTAGIRLRLVGGAGAWQITAIDTV